MKRYTVTVNGVVYDVTVEENAGAGATSAPVATAPVAPAPTAPAPAKTAPAAPAANAKYTVSAPMPGNILSVNVKVGDKVEKGAILCVLEAMKMENEIMAPDAGTVTSVLATKGATVNSGDTLVTLA